jgi:hypothetical protein
MQRYRLEMTLAEFLALPLLTQHAHIRRIMPDRTANCGVSDIAVMVDESLKLLHVFCFPFRQQQPPHQPANQSVIIPFRKPIEPRDLDLPELNPPRMVRRKGVWSGTYEEYLRHPQYLRNLAEHKKQWRSIGLYRCVICNCNGPLEFHHRSYRGVPFGEYWDDYSLLCEKDHAIYHGRLPKPPVGLFDVFEEEERKAA